MIIIIPWYISISGIDIIIIIITMIFGIVAIFTIMIRIMINVITIKTSNIIKVYRVSILYGFIWLYIILYVFIWSHRENSGIRVGIVGIYIYMYTFQDT